jgi:hypothetical protein
MTCQSVPDRLEYSGKEILYFFFFIFSIQGTCKVVYLRHVRLSACVRAAPTGRIFMKFDTGDFYENLSRKSGFG